VAFKSGAYDCEALITPRDDGWLSPFTINGKPIFSPTERGIIKSLRGSMVQKEFKDQPGQIIAAGKFRIKGWAS
jgi:hypothetical protein